MSDYVDLEHSHTHLHPINCCGPVAEDEALEVELLLEHAIYKLAVLACLGLVDLVVGAPRKARDQSICATVTVTSRSHNTAHPSPYGLGKWPCVDLVECAVIYIGAVYLKRFGAPPEVFLFVCDAGKGAGSIKKTGTR